jgi:lipopolysaccharide/colanic/teichoic acid biosynthesis glycosyltransferase
LSSSNSLYSADISPSLERRALDIVVSVILLLLLSPLLLCLALAVKLSGAGPVFYRQLRLGQGGRPFTLIKFRSMRGGDGPQVTVDGDPRVTRVGALLRRTSLDELPQFWHVLRGKMTLVGPRPDTVELAARYPRECQWVLQHRPGITGPAQLYLRDAAAIPAGVTDVEEYYLTCLVSRRVALDATFLARPSARSALRFCLLTAAEMLGLLSGGRLTAVDVDVEAVGHE